MSARTALAASLLVLTACTGTYFVSSAACVRGTGFDCVAREDLATDAGPAVVSLFLIGDAGEPDPPPPAAPMRDRVLGELAADIEDARRGGSEARLVYLGDNIYPDGLRDATSQGRCAGARYCPLDAEQLDAQLDAIPEGTETYFLSGNHDWGNISGPEAYARIVNQAVYLEERGQALIPPVGCPGPTVRDVVVDGEVALRMVFLDTQWLLLPTGSRPDRESSPPAVCTYTDDDVMERLTRDLSIAVEAPVALLMHHPMRTYGDHGGRGSLTSAVVYRAGWSAQDVNAAPYARLIDRIDRVLEQTAAVARHPVLVGAGHEHALQVIYDPETDVHHLVSGSGSKVSTVGVGPGSEFSAGFPGFMRVDIHQEGTVTLRVRAMCPPRALEPLGAAVEHDGGVTCEVGDFRTVFAKAIR
ncbi:MAG: hypothetical protein MJB57_04365 [Gemmatimonadetes bacterium]|nr:hypothetical protein [Gemmatimonadota bacterium]